MKDQFWNGKRVLITGHTGFKGSWLSLWLQQLGAVVTGYALNPPTSPSLFVVANVACGMTSIIGDIRNPGMLMDVMQKTQPEIVFHMAAQALVRDSYEYPLETYATNVMGCVNLLESVRQTRSVRAVVNVTSDKCYENKEWFWGYRETDRIGGYDPYSNSKACAELVTSAYRDSYFNSVNYAEHGVAIATARAGNVIGGGDWAKDRLIPDIVRSILADESVKIRNPQGIRPWQHVLEPLNGYLLLAKNLCSTNGIEFAAAWNFGANADDTKSVDWIVDRLTMLWGEGAGWEIDAIASGLHETNHLKLDCSKAKAVLGWYPRWGIETSLDSITNWYKSQMYGVDMREFTLQQIDLFLQSDNLSSNGKINDN